MNQPLLELSQSYQTALSRYLTEQPPPSLSVARELGERAVLLGLETLDMAKLHVEAKLELILALGLKDKRDDVIKRATVFFAEAITPIERTHRGAREAAAHLTQIVKALTERTAELASSVEGLKQEVLQRKLVEDALRTSEGTTRALLASSRLMQDELRHLSRQLLAAQEEERRRISRELHDVIAQTLTSINVRLAELVSESTTNTDELQKKISSTQQLVEKSVEIVHRFARELRPSVLDDLGLIPALQTYMQDFLRDTGVRVSLKAAASVESASNATRTVLYRVVQEALTNVARHAKVSCAAVIIDRVDGDLRMEVKDDGVGFNVDGGPTAKKHNRLGLLGMRERVEMIGGTLCIESTPGSGTIVRVEIPHEKDTTPKSSSSTSLECE